ncbi:MAG: serine/threonine-protein kinase [Bryobacteraceae bacterium]
MTPAQFQRVEEIFHGALALDPSARKQWLDDTCGDDAELRSAVASMLEADEQPTAGQRIVESALSHLADATGELPPRKLGAYRVVRPLGAGGMGAVYLAERDDDQFRKQVAVKVLRTAVGFRLDELLQRFTQERQILADLEHPNIARLLDGGADESGRPYLVLEYVDGVNISAYCKANALSLAGRCRLFVSICDAVAFAHRHLVIHRDIKPANILVNREGVPKLLDFGVAKLLPTSTVAATMAATEFGMFTAEYAAPEQILNTAVTTATDVYSLGAVLYELMAGRAWFDGANLSMAELVRRVTEGEIPALAGAPADLDNVVRKAMAREPERRYATADRLAADVRNWLEGRPVEARGNDFWYRTGKMLRRNWRSATAASLAVVSLVAGLAIASRERNRAETRFNEVRGLARHVLFDLEPAIRPLEGSLEARQKLAATAQAYLDRLAHDPAASDDLKVELAEAYERLAEIEGGVMSASMGKADAALVNLRQAVRLRGEVLGRSPNDPARLRAAATAYRQLGESFSSRSKHLDAAEAFRNATVEFEQLLKSDASRPADTGQAAATYLSAAQNAVNAFETAGAENLVARAEQLSRDWVKASDDTASRRGLARSLTISGLIRRSRGDLEYSEKAIGEALDIALRLERENPGAELAALVAQTRQRLADVTGEPGRISLERYAEAEKLIRQAIVPFREGLSKNPRNEQGRYRLAHFVNMLGALEALHDPVRAAASFDESLALLRAVPEGFAAREQYLIYFLVSSTYPLRRVGRGAEADHRLAEAFILLEKSKEWPTKKVDPLSPSDLALRAKAAGEFAAGRIAAALEALREIEQKLPPGAGDDDLDNAYARSTFFEQFIATLVSASDTQGAERVKALRTALWERLAKRYPRSSFVRRELDYAGAPLPGVERAKVRLMQQF